MTEALIERKIRIGEYNVLPIAKNGHRMTRPTIAMRLRFSGEFEESPGRFDDNRFV